MAAHVFLKIVLLLGPVMSQDGVCARLTRLAPTELTTASNSARNAWRFAPLAKRQYSQQEAEGNAVTGREPRGVDDIRCSYAARGYEMLTPDDLGRMDNRQLSLTTAGATEVLDLVNLRNRQLSAARADQLSRDVTSGDVRLFVLRETKSKRVVATTQFTRVRQPFLDSKISSYEMGRFAKRPEAPRRLAGRLNEASYLWVADRLQDVDYLVSQPRVPRAKHGRPFNGNVLGAVLRQNHIPAHAVYANFVTPTAAEPFVFAVLPLNRMEWRSIVTKQQVYLPDDGRQPRNKMLGDMLEGGPGVQVRYVKPEQEQELENEAAEDLEPALDADIQIHEVHAPSPTSESLYVLTRRPMTPRKTTVSHIPGTTLADGKFASAGLSDRVVLEDDIVSRADSVHTLEKLRRLGFEPAGWTPSALRFGRIALVLTRLGTVPAKGVFVAQADLRALNTMSIAQRFLTDVLSRQPVPALE